jgi:hypothetical protein
MISRVPGLKMREPRPRLDGWVRCTGRTIGVACRWRGCGARPSMACRRDASIAEVGGEFCGFEMQRASWGK